MEKVSKIEWKVRNLEKERKEGEETKKEVKEGGGEKIKGKEGGNVERK